MSSTRMAQITAVGDISFMGGNADNPSLDVFESVIPIFNESDLVIANLENPLVNAGCPVTGKCVLRGNTGWAVTMKNAGINVVSLANNHIMDHGVVGLDSTMNALEKANIAHVGAGPDIEHACRPLIKHLNGYRMAFLARTAVIVDSPSYAGASIPGVAFLDMNELLRKVIECRNMADIEIVLIHWGLENYEYPTPLQRNQAKALIEAGANLIIGHHPHVLQGYERFGKGLVAYSLGNFLFQEFDWTINTHDGSLRKMRLCLTPENRNGIILKTTVQDKGILVEPVFTCIGEDGGGLLDRDAQRLEMFHRLSKRLSNRAYNTWWKIYALKKEWQLRIGKRMSIQHLFQRIYRLRPRHVEELYRLIRNALRITSGKSTNPYD